MKINLLMLLLCASSFVFAQKYTISGYVTDVENGEKLIGSNAYNALDFTGTVTNNYGFYSITLPKGEVLFTASFVGYAPYQKLIALDGDLSLNIELKPTIEIEEVVVEGRSALEGVESSQMSTINIPMKTIKNLPVLLGEADIIKSIQLLPGVQSGSEGMSGMYVRGGGPDQNLILLDGVPVYNVSHLFGFFSVFNADAIQNVKLIKGGFPARYGGRLSSVLDISMKEGSNKEFKGSGSIGLISSKLALEGPIGDKATFIVSGRRTYIDVLAYPIVKTVQQSSDIDKLRYGYFFHDFNAKINYKFSDKSRLYASTYIGKDKFYSIEEDRYTTGTSEWDPNTGEIVDDFEEHYYKDEMQFWWGNVTAAMRWNYQWSNKLFSNLTGTYSRYKILTGFDSEHGDNYKDKMTYTSGIYDIGLKGDFDYFLNNNHSIRFGVLGTNHNFNPGVFVEQSTGVDSTSQEYSQGNDKIIANEVALYAEDDIRIGALVKLNLGLRYSGFQVRDKYYQSLEPRISSRFLLHEKVSIKAAYARMTQYMNLLANSNIGLPFDLWVPSTDIVKPQVSHQLALGVMYDVNRDFDLSVEGFYKQMDNLVEYKEGATFYSVENDWETKVTQGKGWSYGIEFLLMKSYGKTTGWVGYTWSNSNRQFDTPGEEISFGEKFPYKYDRRHDVSIVVSHQIKDNIDIGATWVFGTGNATTLGYEKYPMYNQSASPQVETPDPWMYYNNDQEPQIVHIDGRNNYRMPAYHRLDIGVNFHKEKKWGKRTWNISVYNVYNRQNPFILQWERDYETNKYKLMQVSLFPMIPSVSYRFEF